MFNKDFLIFSLMTFFTVAIWTALEVYHVHTITTVPANLQETIEPLNPKLNTKIIEELKTRYTIESLPTPAVMEVVKIASPSVKATVTPTIISTPTPQI